MIRAAVLAAGESRRMGVPKALLPDRAGTPFVARIVQTLAAAGLPDIVVVTGSHHDPIARLLSARPEGSPAVTLIRNSQPERGQLSSLLCALEGGGDPEALLVTLVDLPLVSTATVSDVLAAWRARRAPIVRPAVGQRHGHPVLFDRSVFPALRDVQPGEGARVVIHALAGRVENVQVTDEGCLRDVDTPDDYVHVMGGAGG